MFNHLLNLRQKAKKICSFDREKYSSINKFRRRSFKKDSHTFPTIENYYRLIKDYISCCLTYPDFAAPWIIPATIRGIQLVRKHEVDIIFSTGMPWSSLIIGYFIKLFTKKKLIVDFRDPWVNNPFFEKVPLTDFLDSKFESLVVKKKPI